MDKPTGGGGILRSIGAVLAGCVVIVILSMGTDAVMHASGVFPKEGPISDGQSVIAAAYRFMFSVAGCWLAARLAPRRPMLHAMILGIIGTLVGIAGAVIMWNKIAEMGPRWYAVVVFAMSLPCAWLGGALVTMRSSRAAGAAAQA